MIEFQEDTNFINEQHYKDNNIIIKSFSIIYRNTQIYPNTLIGHHSLIRENNHIGKGCKIDPIQKSLFHAKYIIM